MFSDLPAELLLPVAWFLTREVEARTAHSAAKAAAEEMCANVKGAAT